MSGRGNTRGRPKGSGINDSDRLADIARLIDADPELKPTTAIKALGISDPSVIRRLRDKYNERHPRLEAARQAEAGADPAVANDTNAAAPETIPVPTRAAAGRSQSGRSHAMAASSRPAARRTAAPSATGKSKKTSPGNGNVAGAAAAAPRSVSETTVSGKADASLSSEPDHRPVVQKRVAPALEAKPVPAELKEEATRSPSLDADRQRHAADNRAASGGTARAIPRRNEELMVSLFGFGIAAASSALAAQVSFAETIVRNSYVSLALRQQVAFNEWALQLTPWSAVKTIR